MKEPVKNIPASIQARLKTEAEQQGRPFAEILQYYAMERFLSRLSKSRYATKFILKGGLLFYAWNIPLRRPTRDIDLRGYVTNDSEILEGILREVSAVSVPGDGIEFDGDSISIEETQIDADYLGVRAKLTAYLGRSRIRIQIDIGFSDALSSKAEPVEYPNLLPQLQEIHLKSYPKEAVVAEKLHAMIRHAALCLLVIGSLACNMATLSPLAAATVQPSTVTVAVQASPVPDDAQPSPTPVPDMAQPSAGLDPCTLVMAAEAEAILGQPVGPASPMNGACAYSNASDALYMVSAAAAQDQETSGILQGQMMMLGFGGVQLDESGVSKLRSLAESMDYRGFFTELVTISQGAQTMTARLVEGGGNDVAYWVWVSAQGRQQGGLVAARGQTLVNINLIVADSQTEEAMLAAASSLADQAFGRLPSKFTLAMPTTQAPPTATLVAPVKTIVGTWERRTAEITEQLVFNADGSYSVEARNSSTNEIVASSSGTFTCDGSTIHYVDKNKKETTETYNLGQDGDVLVIDNQADRPWVRLESSGNG